MQICNFSNAYLIYHYDSNVNQIVLNNEVSLLLKKKKNPCHPSNTKNKKWGSILKHSYRHGLYNLYARVLEHDQRDYDSIFVSRQKLDDDWS